MAVANLDDELKEDIAARWDASVDVEDLNLEDIFLAYHANTKRAEVQV